MTREEWTRKLMLIFAGGHQSDYWAQQARDWLAGKDPPVADDWESTSKKKFEEKAEKAVEFTPVNNLWEKRCEELVEEHKKFVAGYWMRGGE